LLNYIHTAIKVCGFASIVNNTAQLIGRLSNILIAVTTKDYTHRVDKSVNLKLPAGSLYFVALIYLLNCITLHVYQSSDLHNSSSFSENQHHYIKTYYTKG
jgi:hypothetical protein